MHYMLMMYETEAGRAQRSDPANAGPYWASWMEYSRVLVEAGIFVSGAGLENPENATTVRLEQGRRHVQDGPLADSKEQLGGFFIVDVPNLDAALQWASRAPCMAYGGVEVRPTLPPPPAPPGAPAA